MPDYIYAVSEDGISCNDNIDVDMHSLSDDVRMIIKIIFPANSTCGYIATWGILYVKD